MGPAASAAAEGTTNITRTRTTATITAADTDMADAAAGDTEEEVMDEAGAATAAVAAAGERSPPRLSDRLCSRRLRCRSLAAFRCRLWAVGRRTRCFCVSRGFRLWRWYERGCRSRRFGHVLEYESMH